MKSVKNLGSFKVLARKTQQLENIENHLIFVFSIQNIRERLGTHRYFSMEASSRFQIRDFHSKTFKNRGVSPEFQFRSCISISTFWNLQNPNHFFESFFPKASPMLAFSFSYTCREGAIRK